VTDSEAVLAGKKGRLPQAAWQR